MDEFICPIEERIPLSRISKSCNELVPHLIFCINKKYEDLSDKLLEIDDFITRTYFIEDINLASPKEFIEIIKVPLNKGSYQITVSFYGNFPSTFGFMKLY